MTAAYPRPLPAGRLPDPPPSPGWIMPLLVGLLLLASVGMGVTGAILWAMIDSAAGPPLALTGGGLLLLLPLFGLMSRLERRARPGRELCWAPVALGQPFTLSFRAEQARYHGVWFNLDLRFRAQVGYYFLNTQLQVVSQGQAVLQTTAAVHWGVGTQHGSSTGHTSWSPQWGAPPRGAPGPLSKWEIDRTVELDGVALAAGPQVGARYRGLSLLLQLPDLRPGQDVSVHAVVVPADFLESFQAHAFVALGPSA